ncbi:MAG: hypothetical protein AAB490_04240 [Patescibacteria group bacterium]
MARIDLMFCDDGTGNVAYGRTIEEDQQEDRANSGDSTIVAHVTFEENDEDFRGAVVDVIYATHTIECAGCAGELGCTVFERFISEIFKAGLEYGRASALQSTTPSKEE